MQSPSKAQYSRSLVYSQQRYSAVRLVCRCRLMLVHTLHWSLVYRSPTYNWNWFIGLTLSGTRWLKLPVVSYVSHLLRAAPRPWRGPSHRPPGLELPASHWTRTWRPGGSPCRAPARRPVGTSSRSGRSPSCLLGWTGSRISPWAPGRKKKECKRYFKEKQFSSTLLHYGDKYTGQLFRGGRGPHLEGACLQEHDLVMLTEVLEARDPLGKLHHLPHSWCEALREGLPNLLTGSAGSRHWVCVQRTGLRRQQRGQLGHITQARRSTQRRFISKVHYLIDSPGL